MTLVHELAAIHWEIEAASARAEAVCAGLSEDQMVRRPGPKS